jgi:TolB-like protein/Flp pilus assembly protein TadD
MHPSGPIHPGDSQTLTPAQGEQVRHHLEEVVASPAFAGSKRTQDFLRLIVGHTLEGDFESLRERMIGAELFGRPVSYDTGSDSVVRVRASEARKKLALYYSQLREAPVLQIELPAGSYVPRFHFLTAQEISAALHPVHSIPSGHSASAHADAPDSPESATGSLLPQKLVRQILRLRILAIAAFAIALILVGFVVYQQLRGRAGKGEQRSIAVLPLENLSGSPDQDFFADGMTEELINNLGQVSTLRVTSLTSSMSYKGSRKKLPDIARELGVDTVIEGGVLKEGDQVRISTQLIDAHTDRPIWAHTYVHQLTTGSDWQGEVAQAIAAEISITITPQEQARLSRRHTVIPDAQDLYLHGILLRDGSQCSSAIEQFQRALQIDPNYAEAHSALATCYGMLGESGHLPYLEAFTKQKAEALKAIELDDSLSEAHAERANTAMTLDRNWPIAEAEFRRALELNPSSSTSHEKYAFYLVRTGHPREALAEIEKSVALDPVSASTFHAQGFIYFFSRQYDKALAVTRTVQGLKINFDDWNFLIACIEAEKGQFQDSIATYLKAGSDPYTLGHLGNVYARAGQTDAARKQIALLEEEVKRNGVGRYEIALVYTGLNDRNAAFHWLEEAYNNHDVGLVYLKVDPCLDPLRSDPRYDSLLQRIGLN